MTLIKSDVFPVSQELHTDKGIGFHPIENIDIYPNLHPAEKVAAN